MQFEIFVEDEELVARHMDVIKQKLTASLMLMVEALRADELRRSTAIGNRVDWSVVKQSAELNKQAVEREEDRKRRAAAADAERKRELGI